MESEYYSSIIIDTEDIYYRLPLSMLSFACEYCEEELGDHICIPKLLDLIEDDSEFASVLEEVLDEYL